MTLVLRFDLDIVTVCVHTQNEFIAQVIEKLEAETDTETGAHIWKYNLS